MKVYDWHEIKDKYTDSLLIGNGASIAVDQRFKYGSLYEKACRSEKITNNVKKIFKTFKTKDFEYVLRLLWYASKINEVLEVTNTKRSVLITNEYNNIRNALIEIIRDIHPQKKEIAHIIKETGTFLKNFKNIVSLNYDLILYWIMLDENDKIRNRFKDCFVGSSYNYDIDFKAPYKAAGKATLVHYLHGNIILTNGIFGAEEKIIKKRDGELLEAVFAKWRSGVCSPLFVSEGTSEQKMEAINRSAYLKHVYDDILTELGENLVIYGWSIAEQDEHILGAIMKCKDLKKIAISVTGNNDEERIAKGMKMISKIREVKGVGVRNKGKKDYAYELFNATSEGAWIY